MWHAERDRLLQRSLPRGKSLTGDGEDQVQIQPLKPGRAGHCDAAVNIHRVVMSFEDFQLGWIEALRSEAESVDTILAEHSAIVIGDGCGIGFDRPFGHVRQIDPLPQPADQLLHLFQGQQTGCPSAEENRDRRYRKIVPMVGFAQDQVDKSPHAIGGLAGDAVKVAVMAFVEAERDVNIETLYRGCGQRCRQRQSLRWRGVSVLIEQIH